MKKLTRIKLVNWHLFTNQTIDIKDNTLISGENGSGKSTLLDAMQYLLVGGRGGAKFNIAATDDAKRTLEGYVRGRIGAENKEFLRNGDVVSHLALEFFDEQSKRFSIIGVVLDLPKGATLKERFYILEGLSIHDEMFLSKKYPRDYKDMKKTLKSMGVDMEPFETQKKYREALARFFGMDATKYAKILPKALAFRSIDLQQFVFEFLLDDDPIDIQSLKNNVAQLKKVEAQIKHDREKLEKLDQIVQIGSEITGNKEQQAINTLIDQLNWIEKRESFIRTNEEKIQTIEGKLTSLREDKSHVDSMIEDCDNKILDLERMKNDNDLNRTLKGYQEKLAKKASDLESQKETLGVLKENLDKEFQLAKELSNHLNSQSVKGFVTYYQQNQDSLHADELQNHLSMVAKDIEAYREAYAIEKDKLETAKGTLSDEIRTVRERLDQLRRAVKTYPPYVQKLIDALNSGLSELYRKEVNVRPLCELIEVADEHWRNALEGYLNTQRFDIIVDPAWFNDALEIYDRVKFQERIYGVGLVNTQKLSAYDDTAAGTLAEMVVTDHRYARQYVNMALNSLYCVEEAKDLKNYHRAITPTCMTYSNHTARQINPRAYETPYIGKQATVMQISIETERLKSLEKQMDKFYELTSSSDRVQRLLVQSHSAQIVHQNLLRYFDLIKKTRQEYIGLEEQIESLGKDTRLEQLDKRIEEERIQRKQHRLESDRIVGEIASLRGERQTINDHIEDVKEKLEEFMAAQAEMAKKHPEKLGLANTQFYALKTRYKGDHDSISTYLAQSSTSLNTQIIKAEADMVNMMRQFIISYHFSAGAQADQLIHFEEEANIIRNNNLVRYEQEATELRRNSETGFKEEFVNKLKASIENAQQQIAELNIALEGKTFGSDSYQLVCRAAEDPEYKPYYDMIMGNDAFSKHTLFTENLTKRNASILMELFEKISSSDPEYDKLMLKFLDYRNYMSYDIEVTNLNGNTSFFSKVSKEKSGGETQVPFYIVIAASFQQLLTKNRRIDAGCIVLFDEAFNNMDESRIDAMMKFYNSLSIQLLIAVPPQRVSNIINFVNTSLVIVKDNDYAIVETFKDDRILAS